MPLARDPRAVAIDVAARCSVVCELEIRTGPEGRDVRPAAALLSEGDTDVLAAAAAELCYDEKEGDAAAQAELREWSAFGSMRCMPLVRGDPEPVVV
mmetsp:Transcript_8390/g.29826  ORF Transcript_8390/g.29826 Transcript_8390/m.29826 type:complete len:97 (+) Transcript_8390:2118-2408(+)